jgi:hypothetical protein
MRFCTSVLGPTIVLALAVLPYPRLHAQQVDPASTIATPIQPIPEAPTPQIEIARAIDPQTPQQPQTPTPAPSQPDQQPQTPVPDQSSSSQTSSSSSNSSQSSQQQPDAQKTHQETAEEQLKEQESQRVAGIMATFNTTRNPNALPLSSSQKYRLFFKGAFDPWAFGLTAFVAGIGLAEDSTPEWGGGMHGYGKRLGAGYADYFMGNFFGNAVLTSLLHEDPRYFQKGSGRPMKRVLWAAASTVWCKRDKGGWGPNYANVGGNLIGAAIGRVYYPAADRTVSSTISDGLTVSAEGILGAEVIEWWPDLVRYHQRKQAEKQARATNAANGQKKGAMPEDQNQK